MKFAIWIFYIALLIAFASAGVIPQEDYLPPRSDEELAVEEQPAEETAALADDGYRYKTVRKLRHRRDVSELVGAVEVDDGYHYEAPESTEPLAKVSNEYLPPNQEASEIKETSEVPEVPNEYLPPAEEVLKIEEVPVTTEASEVSEAPLVSEEPEVRQVPEAAEVSNEYLPPADDSETIEVPVESAVLADDGYRYRTIRHRRDVSEIVARSSGYLYEAPVAATEVPNVYLPPAEVKEPIPEATEAPEVANEYLPPVAEVKEAPEVVDAPAETAELADDGYRYKTVRRLKYRHRRDVSEIVAPSSGYLYEVPVATKEVPNVYLPPAEVKEAIPEATEAPEVANEYLPPVAEVKEAPVVVDAPAETAELADDGYRYKTVRRLKYRHRRDVSEIVAPSSGYLYEAPAATKEVPNVYLPPAEVKEAIPKATEAPEVANEYLPPVAEVKEAPEVVDAPAETAELADDGYRYKTVRRLKYRHRRDVSEIAAPSSGYLYEAPVATKEVPNVYLPPAEVKEAIPEATEAPEVANEYLPPVAEVKEAPEVVDAPAETAELADDGYRYKTVRRLKYRHRRDVSEIVAPSSGYLYEAPVATKEVPNVYLPPAEVKEAIPEATEAPEVANEYLPPVAEVKEAPEVVDAPAETAELADDGYRYKTVRRLKYRHRRDVSEIIAPSSGYLYEAPVATKEVPNVYLPPAEVKEAIPEATEAPDVANEYLPPVAEVKEAPEVVDAPAETAELADDGYRYKTVRRLKYRHRRDVSEIVAPSSGYLYEAPVATKEVPNVYLPPAEVKEAIPEATEAPEVDNEYLPPVAEVKEAPEVVDAPAETAELADDGYRYKTVRRLKYRHRRDVSEIVAPSSGYLYEAPVATKEVPNVYLPPAEVKETIPEATEAPEVANEYLPPVAEVKEAPEVVDAPAETAELADDGYRYKTVRRLKYRHRRDVSEIIAPSSGYLYEAPVATKEVPNVYLPPAEVKEAIPEATEAPEVANEYLPPVAEVKEAPEVVDAPAETAELADDGYRYKTVRRLKYRHRRDVSEIVAPSSGYLYEAPVATKEVPNVYLPPAEVKEAIPEPTEAPEVANEYLPPVAEVKEAPEVFDTPAETAELGDDGYRYKTVRRLKYRHRRDVSEIIAPESAVLGDDGYHYRTPESSETNPKLSNEYLPPVEEVPELKESTEAPELSTEASIITEATSAATEAVPIAADAPTTTEVSTTTSEAPIVSNEYLPTSDEVPELKEASEFPEESAVLAEDGYHYKVGKRFRFRRDVTEIAAPQNAPSGYFYPSPIKEALEIPVETPAEDSATLADDGYRYKTVRRIRYRRRRDVSELVAPIEETAVLADDGYHYKKPENELRTPNVASEYLPPVNQVAQVNEAPAAPVAEAIEDASPISNAYLPPNEEALVAPEESAVLADDGYRYKTVRRIRYRHRRDVSELVNTPSSGYVYEAPATSEPITNEYLPPVVEAAEAAEVNGAKPEPTELAPEVSNEYLPPADETLGDAEIVDAPQESAVLSDDAYRYKTVKRIRY